MTWWRRFRHRDELERQLDAELREHLERLTADYIAGGMDEREARRTARLDFGGLDQVKEACRDEHAAPFLDAVVQDLRFALRRFAKAPAFTASAVVVLALGIGVNAAVFDLAHTLLFAPPPFFHASELVQVFSQDKTAPKSYRDFSYPTYRDIREQSGVFADATGFNVVLTGVGQKGDARRTLVSIVSSNYFSVLGVPLVRGRSFTPEEETPGRPAFVAIVSHAYWQTHDLDPAVLGSQLLIQGHPFTIVGIAPRGFTGTSLFSIDVWMPLSVYDQVGNDFEVDDRNPLGGRAGQQLKVIGRLKPATSAAGAQPQLAGLASNLEKAFPVEQKDQTFTIGPVARFAVSSAPANEAGWTDRLGLLLLGMSSVVLLVACLNLANMLLARGMARRREIAIRLAIGGSRVQIVRQLLIEGFVLALVGGSTGLTLGLWSTRVSITSLNQMIPFGLIWTDGPSWQVLLATLGFCVAATLGFALGPALELSRSSAAAHLKEQAGESMRGRGGWLSVGNALVVIQIAISLALLTTAALFVHGATKAASVDTHLRPGDSLLLETDASLAGLSPAAAEPLYEKIREQLAAQPGIERVAIAATVPFGIVALSRSVQRAGVRAAAGSKPATAAEGLAFGAAWNSVSAEYFETAGLPIRRGRAFSAEEATQSNRAPVAIIDDILAKQLWPDSDAFGQYIRYAGDDAPRAERPGGGGAFGYSADASREDKPGEIIEIVGIVPAARRGLSDRDPVGQIYVPFAHGYQSNITYFVRFRSLTRGNKAAAADMIRRTVHDADPSLPILSLRTFDEHLAGSPEIWFVRAGAAVFSVFGVLALGLAVVGLYAVRSYAVARRTREVGIRMALGAERRDILRMFFCESSLTLGSGISLGLLLAVLAGRALTELLYEVGPQDAVAFITAPLILATATLIATWLPARRATRIAPTVALRTE